MNKVGFPLKKYSKKGDSNKKFEIKIVYLIIEKNSKTGKLARICKLICKIYANVPLKSYIIKFETIISK